MAMKRTIITLAAATAVTLGLTACDGADATVPVPAATTTAPAPTTEAELTDDDLFLIVISEEIPNAGPAHIDLAKSVCRAFDAGATVEQVFLTLIGASDHLTAEQLGTLVGAGIGAYCPEHDDLIGGQ